MGISTAGMEKRAFKRRILRLKGVCSGPGATSREVEIRDFCPGGMLLAFSNRSGDKSPVYVPTHGDIVHIRCTIPSFHDQPPIAFNGRIVRIDAEGAGLAFIDPDLDALHSLHKIAKQRAETASVPRRADPAPSEPVSPGDQNKKALLETCRRISEECSETLISAFVERAPERLTRAAEMAENITEKNAFYDASQLFSQATESFKQSFCKHVADILRQIPGAVDFNHPFDGGSSKPQLSLVEEDAFEEWLAYSDMVHKAEITCLEQLSDLTHRVGVLFHAPINKDTNPFAPAAFAKAFQNAIRHLTIDAGPLHVLYGVYRDTLLEHLAELYTQLNDYLIKAGILADLRHKYRVKRAPETSASADTAKTASPLVTEAVAKLASARPPTQTMPSAMPGQDWYSLVQHIDALQKKVLGPSRRPAMAAYDEPADQISPQANYFTQQELAQALSKLAISGHSQLEHPQDIRPRILSILGSGQAGAEQKQLPGREEKILDMAGNLLESVLSDKLLSNNVRPWLQRLSVPVFKMALNDESIFSDKSHLVRQVINALSQLEFYGSDEGDPGQQVITHRIDGLLSEIENTEPINLQVFGRVMQELRVLISVQNKAYEENLQDALTLSEAEERETVASNVPTSILPLSAEEEADLREWKKRVRRLKLGDNLLLDAETRPRRLKLAWISENHKRFVFVNVKGLKELTLTRQDLALGMRSGAYIVLDDGGDTLLDRAQYTMLQKMHSHLLHETTHDQLTGLINRREFERRLGQALASAREHGMHHVICYIDLTQFNVVNNTFGYEGGDRLLAEIAELFDSQLGDRGVLARIGGDEFGMLLEKCSNLEALAITARYKEAMQNYRFSYEDKSLSISFSAGLVEITNESDSVASSVQAAEACCKIARGKGANYIQVFNPADSGLFRHMEILKWVSKIDEALENESLDLRYQPIVGIKTELLTTHHAEILLNVLDDQGQSISPADFVLAAEHFRRMSAVDRWVIERAFAWMVDHPEQLDEMGGLAINLSGSSLNEEGFVDFILELANKTEVPMDKVCFEITETAGIASLSNASEFILAVKKTGCMFALDDFGSGLSSYAYLKNLPVDFLKIDGVFIKNMDTNPYDFAVVKSITEIGHFMGKEIIAEYVENDSILSMLREIGVDYAQGYAIAKPQRLSLFQPQPH